MSSKDELVKEYKRLYDTAKLMIENIKSVGYTGSNYEDRLNGITSNTNDSFNKSGGSAMATYAIDYNKSGGSATATYDAIDYNKRIEELKDLIEALKGHNTYFTVLASCNLIRSNIQNENISIAELQENVDKMKENLNNIGILNTDIYDNKQNVARMIYELAYRIIKLEILKTGTSQLYDHIKNKQIGLLAFHELIKKELAELKGDKRDDSLLREKLLQIKAQGIGSNYFDLDLIKIIMICEGNDSIKTNVNKQANELLVEIKDNSKAIAALNNSVNNQEGNLGRKRNSVKDQRKSFYTKLAALLGTISVILTIGIAGPRIIKKTANKDKYLKTTQTYSTIMGEVAKEETEVFFGGIDGKPRNGTELIVYGEYRGGSQRICEKYDFTNYDFDSVIGYCLGNSDDYPVAPSYQVLDVSKDSAKTDHPGSFAEATKITYEYEGRDYSEKAYNNRMIALIVISIIILISAEATAFDMEGYHPLIINLLLGATDELKDLLKQKKGYKEMSAELTEKVNKLMELINKDKVLKEKFDRVYEANRYLLDNPEELSKQISSLPDIKVMTKAKQSKSRL